MTERERVNRFHWGYGICSQQVAGGDPCFGVGMGSPLATRLGGAAIPQSRLWHSLRSSHSRTGDYSNATLRVGVLAIGVLVVVAVAVYGRVLFARACAGQSLRIGIGMRAGN